MSYSHDKRKKAIKKGSLVTNPATGELSANKLINGIYILVALSKEMTSAKR